MHPWFVSTCCCRRFYRLLCPGRKRESKPTHSRKNTRKTLALPFWQASLKIQLEPLRLCEASQAISTQGKAEPEGGSCIYLPLSSQPALYTYSLKSVWRSHAPYDFPNKKCFNDKSVIFRENEVFRHRRFAGRPRRRRRTPGPVVPGCPR